MTDRFETPDGKGRFTSIDLPEETIPEGQFLLTTRRGKQFNSMVGAEIDPLVGASRDAIFMSREDAHRLKLASGDPVILRNKLGEYRGRIVIERVKPGSVQVYWPEANHMIPAGRLDPCGIPDYNATVEIVPAGG